ncbi:MAG: glycosyltransferase [Isosphaeraceae bacterium]
MSSAILGTKGDPTPSRPHGASLGAVDLSVLVPVFNEVENVGPLHEELSAALGPMPLRYELIFVDDGSIDGTAAELEAIQRRDPSTCARLPLAELRPDGRPLRGSTWPAARCSCRSTGTARTTRPTSRSCWRP